MGLKDSEKTARGAAPAPEPQVIECYSTCSVGCVQAGHLQGGLCDASGTCTCMTGVEASKREAAPAPAPQFIECSSTCSSGCIAAGQLNGGICSADG